MNEKEVKKVLAKQLKKLRSKADLTQQDVVSKIGEEYLSLRTYKTYEQGNENYLPDLEKVIRLAEFFNVSIDYLLFNKESTDDNSFTWLSNIKRLSRLIYCMVLNPEKDPTNGKYIFKAFDKETEIYLDQLIPYLKDMNYQFDTKNKLLSTSIQHFERIPDSIKEDNTDLSPNFNRLVQVSRLMGIENIELNIDQSVKDKIEKVK